MELGLLIVHSLSLILTSNNLLQFFPVTKNVFLLETHKDTEFVDYIDSVTPLYIIMEYKNKKYYMDMDEDNGLILIEKKPENRLYLLNRDLEKDDTVQQIDTKKLFDDRVDYMNKTMQTYLQRYFPDKSGEGTRIVTLSSCKDKFVRILGIIIIIAIAF